MSEARRVLLVGATGLVGRKVIGVGRNVPGLSLVALARREMQLPRGARMEMMLAPPQDWQEAIAAIGPDAVICALGTTRAKAGSEGLVAVDEALVLEVASAAFAAGARNFAVISSIGADAQSRNAYLQIKGRMEQALRKIGFARLDIVRPGLLLGKRAGDVRLLEKMGQWLSPLIDIFLAGSKRRYRSIAAVEVALAALQCTRENARGTFVHEHDDIRRLAIRLRRDSLGESP